MKSFRRWELHAPMKTRKKSVDEIVSLKYELTDVLLDLVQADGEG